MANKRTSKTTKTTKKSTSSSTGSRVTRITASDKTASKKSVKPTPAKKQKVATAKPKRKLSLRRKKSTKPTKALTAADVMEVEPTKNPLRALGRYFKGAWYELNQVRWPDRPTTWQMTAALLAFTIFFVALIVLLDSLFKYLFEFILA